MRVLVERLDHYPCEQTVNQQRVVPVGRVQGERDEALPQRQLAACVSTWSAAARRSVLCSGALRGPAIKFPAALAPAQFAGLT